MISDNHVVHFEGVEFFYKSEDLFKDFNFNIEANQLVGIIGVNGSGKSTLLKLILGILNPKKGKVEVLSHKAGTFATKHLVGSSLQEVDFPGTEKVVEILEFVCQQYETSLPVQDLIHDFNLTDFQNKPCSQLSGGMKRRLSLACAFAGKPKLVLLDEPSTGLDVESRQHLLENLKKYQKEFGATVLMISHHPEEVISYVDQFFLVKDKNVKPITTVQMAKLTTLKKLTFYCASNISLPSSLHLKREDESVEVITEDGDFYIRQLCDQKIIFRNMQVRELTAEEILGEVL